MFPSGKLISADSTARIFGFLFIILSPFILVLLIERTLSFVHDHISRDLFDNEREMLARNAVLPVKFLLDPNKFAEELRSSKTKIAVFGESSAAGYASSIGFADFLEKALPEHVVVHNFAEPGAPFVGTEAELAKLLMPYYDAIIIYAGHNEVWSYLKEKEIEQKAAISLPWGGRFDHRPGDLRHSMKYMSLQKFLANNFFNFNLTISDRIKSELWGRAYDFSLNSRLVNLIKSSSKKVAQLKESAGSQSAESVQRLPFFVPGPFIGEEAKKVIAANYSRSVLELVDKLRPDQRLIISTVLSNDLFPPLLDFANSSEIPEGEKKAKLLYQHVADGSLDFSKEEVETLPGTAHRPYLQAVLCMNGVSPLQGAATLTPTCLDLALTARGQDTFPNRVDPGINEFIKSLKSKKPNVRVIDPESAIRNAPSQKEYFNYFVDFHHPSAVGHMLIANLIIPELPASPHVSLSQEGDCDTFVAVREGGKREIIPDPTMFKIELRNNIAWHENYMKKVSTPWLYHYYKESAEARMRKCVSQL